MFNRRGQQEGGSLGVIITIILVVIVAIFVAYFFISSSNRGAAVFGNLQTSQLQSVITACQAASSINAEGEYCGVLRKVQSNLYVTCDYSQVKASTNSAITCSQGAYSDALRADCESKVTSYPSQVWTTASYNITQKADCANIQ